MAHNRDRTGRFTPFVVGAALLTLPLAACNDSPMAPGETQGTLEAVVRDDPDLASGVGPLFSPSRVFTSGAFEATARVEVEVDGVWSDLEGLASLDVQAALQGGEQTMGSAVVEAQTYARARVVLTGARTLLVAVDTESGPGSIHVSRTLSIAGGGEVVVEYTQPLTVQADGTTRLVLNLNSHLWVDEGSVEAGAVTRSSFEGAAAVVVR